METYAAIRAIVACIAVEGSAVGAIFTKGFGGIFTGLLVIGGAQFTHRHTHARTTRTRTHPHTTHTTHMGAKPQLGGGGCIALTNLAITGLLEFPNTGESECFAGCIVSGK